MSDSQRHEADPSMISPERRHYTRWRWLRDVLRKQDLTLLLSLFVFATCTYLFLELAEMIQPSSDTLDTRILLALRQPDQLDEPIGPPWLASAMREITALGSWPVVTVIVLFTLGLLLIVRRFRSALLVVAAVGGGALAMVALKAAFERPRPSTVPHLVDVLSQSFPSGHATIAVVTYVTLGAMATQLAHRRLVQVYLLSASIVLALLVGLTRVYLGVHYPSDVLAGWCLGLGWASLCLVATRLLMRYGIFRAPAHQLNPPREHPPPQSGLPQVNSKNR